MEYIDVLPIGTKVIIGNSIHASIAGVWIREKGFVQYDCVWWDENQRHSMWLAPDEISGEVAERLKVGFAKKKG